MRADLVEADVEKWSLQTKFVALREKTLSDASAECVSRLEIFFVSVLR